MKLRRLASLFLAAFVLLCWRSSVATQLEMLDRIGLRHHPQGSATNLPAWSPKQPRLGPPAIAAVGGRFEPAPGERGWLDAPASGETYAILLLDRVPDPTVRETLEARGATVLDVFPPTALLLRLDPSAASLGDLAGAVWMGPFPATAKIHPLLRQRMDEDPSAVARIVASPLGRDARSERDLLDALDRLGAEVSYHSPLLAVAELELSFLNDLVADPVVLHVEAWHAPETLHQQSMVLVQADRARAGLEPWTNLGASTSVGIADSGYFVEHESLPQPTSARSFVGIPTGCGGTDWLEPLEDGQGHGTHVAGTAIGRGGGDFSPVKGVAPAVSTIHVARIFDDGDGAGEMHIEEALDWMAQDTDTEVGNHSWGCCDRNACENVLRFGTGARARQFDQLSADEGVVWVNAAGNYDAQGSCTVVQQYGTGCSANDLSVTLGTPADSKNSIAVANTQDGSHGAGDLTTNRVACGPSALLLPAAAFIDDRWVSSSQGPTQDGRNKPDIAAPGRTICSADSTDTDGYLAIGGTSMAAPHVTGAVAQLLDAATIDLNAETPSIRRRPDAVKAMLRAASIPIRGPFALPDGAVGAGRLDAWKLVADRDMSDGWVRGLYLGPALGAVGATDTFTVDVPADADRVAVVLAWSEDAAASGACRAVNNDLDLELFDAAGTLVGQSTSAVDNVETIVARGPAVQPVMDGTWTVRISAQGLPAGTQAFAVATVVDRGDPEGVVEANWRPDCPVTGQAGTTITCELLVESTDGLAPAVYVQPWSTGAFVQQEEWSMRDGSPIQQMTTFLWAPPDVVLGDVRPGNAERTIQINYLLAIPGTATLRARVRWQGGSILAPTHSVTVTP